MLRRWLALLLLPCGVAALQAEPDPAPLDLTGARILASPGFPAALKPFLPAGREVETLALPLPAGPLLVLGLVDRDPAAREVGTSLLKLAAGDDLAGGYVVSAARADDRPLVVILAADAAALMAARFELETFVPNGKDGAPRSVEFGKPDEQGGVRAAPGLRRVKPRFKIRAAAGLGPGESVLDIAGAHANRLWVNDKTTDRELAQLRDHGVEPVVVAAINDKTSRETVLAWQARGVRRFVADLRGRVGSALTGPNQTFLVQEMAEALRPGGLDELLVLPGFLDDRTAPPDLRKLPEARIGWSGPTEQPLEITRAQAERRAKEAGVPVLLVETWMEACAGEPLRIPSLPRGRAADLGDVLAGVVVLPGPASADALAAAWAAPTDPDASPELGDLMGACVLNAPDGPTFLIESAACLEQMLLGRYSDSPWMRGLPQRLRERAAALPHTAETLLARCVAEPVAVDGKFSEPGWQASRVLEFQIVDSKSGPIEIRALSDAHRLVVGLRVPSALGFTSLVLRLQPEGAPSPFMLTVPLGQEGGGGASAGHVHVGRSRTEGGLDLEIAFEHDVLRGDPYPTRRFGFDLQASAPHNEAWFPGKSESPVGALLVVR